MPAMVTRRKSCGAWMASVFLLGLLVLCPASAGSERHVDAQLMTHARRLQETEGLNPLFRSRLLKLLPMIAEGFPVDGLLPNHRGNAALHYACTMDDFVLVISLLEHGANPLARTRKCQPPESFLQGHNAAFIRAHLAEFATHGFPSEQKL